jgi:hypothetical protein
MKFLITESQLDSTVQTMIDQTLKEFRNVCDDYDNGQEPPDFLNWDDCDSLNMIENIKVLNTEQVKNTNKYPLINVLVDIEFSSIFESEDLSDFLIALRYRIQQKYKITLEINENELINTNKNRNW